MRMPSGHTRRALMKPAPFFLVFVFGTMFAFFVLPAYFPQDPPPPLPPFLCAIEGPSASGTMGLVFHRSDFVLPLGVSENHGFDNLLWLPVDQPLLVV